MLGFDGDGRNFSCGQTSCLEYISSIGFNLFPFKRYRLGVFSPNLISFDFFKKICHIFTHFHP